MLVPVLGALLSYALVHSLCTSPHLRSPIAWGGALAVILAAPLATAAPQLAPALAVLGAIVLACAGIAAGNEIGESWAQLRTHRAVALLALFVTAVRLQANAHLSGSPGTNAPEVYALVAGLCVGLPVAAFLAYRTARATIGPPQPHMPAATGDRTA